MLLWKLRWFKAGGEVSDQHWRDVLGLLRSSAARLDHAYLDRWVEPPGVAGQLSRARAQAAR